MTNLLECGHKDNEPLELRALCHLTSGLTVKKHDTTLVVGCKACGMFVASFALKKEEA